MRFARRFSSRPRAAMAATALFAAATGVAFGGCDSAASLCDRSCDCTGCSDLERQDCYDTAEDAALDAEQEGCTAEYDDFIACAHEAFECEGDDVRYDNICLGETAELFECINASN